MASYCRLTFYVSSNHIEASVITVNTKTSTANFPPSKTDKPRPHACATCARAFTRLEHLKRHERCHTKEKPFECPDCKRRFARQDLLLRHRQKLHHFIAPSARLSNHHEGASGVTIGQPHARKNSTAGPIHTAPLSPAPLWPGANNISVLDSAAMAERVNAGVALMHPPPSRHDSLIGPPFHVIHGQSYEMSSVIGDSGRQHGLIKMETNGFSYDQSLRTAPTNVVLREGFTHDLFGSPKISAQALHVGIDQQSIGIDLILPSFHDLPDLSSQAAEFRVEDLSKDGQNNLQSRASGQGLPPDRPGLLVESQDQMWADWQDESQTMSDDL
ncbi:hypothetical protein F5883DRAFT_582383 [Diaporthe sp. PMI_573]|nr:hypothetical protein F5883DRAFT_582383 [Diaporthaceae sp. PMI_573]